MTFSSLLCSDKHLTVDVSIVQNAKTRYGGLLLVDNRSCIALSKALRKVILNVAHIREGDEILKSYIHRQGATYFPIIKQLSCQGWSSRFRGIKGFLTQENALR